MCITIYADILFLTNLLTDFFLLSLTRKITGAESPFWRRGAASALGGLYACFAFLPSMSVLHSVLMHLLFIPLLLHIGFRIRSIKQLARCALIFLSCVLMCGGVSYALFFMTDAGLHTGAVLKNGILYRAVPCYVPMLGFAAVYTLMQGVERCIITYASRKPKLHTLQIGNITLQALVDTGNALFDPQTGLPVIIVETDVLKQSTKDLRQIYCQTVSGAVSPLPVLGTQTVSVDGAAVRCTIALTEAKLCGDGQFRALLHPAIFTYQGGQNENNRISAKDKKANFHHPAV